MPFENVPLPSQKLDASQQVQICDMSATLLSESWLEIFSLLCTVCIISII